MRVALSYVEVEVTSELLHVRRRRTRADGPPRGDERREVSVAERAVRNGPSHFVIFSWSPSTSPSPSSSARMTFEASSERCSTDRMSVTTASLTNRSRSRNASASRRPSARAGRAAGPRRRGERGPRSSRADQRTVRFVLEIGRKPVPPGYA